MEAGSGPRTIVINETVLGPNDAIAERNRKRLDAWVCVAINVLSSPGSGKTSLLERTLKDLGDRLSMAVVVGDLATDNDARRLSGTRAPVIQINTLDICHLDAGMVSRALDEIAEPYPRLLFIENVGNMVCPAAFQLGEHARAVLMSVTEGEDKPLKYPTLFKTADLVVLTKMDIAEAVGFDLPAALAGIHAVAPQAFVLQTSARTGEGLPQWYDWLEERLRKEYLNADAQRRRTGVP